MSGQMFDLLGDPIPEGWGKRGRPPHLPTQENRNKVMVLQAFDWPVERIAGALGITVPTLRKHYFRELKARADSRSRLEAMNLQRLVNEVASGNVSAMALLYKRLDRSDLLEEMKRRPASRGSARLGKKEQALIDAHRAGEDSEWGSLLN